MAKLNINGKVRDVKVEPDTPLLWVIREQVGLTGTKYGCGVAQCGACSVHINGEVQRSCSIPVGTVKADRQDRHHRGPLRQLLAPGAEGLGHGRRAAMRLLPVRPDHGGGGAAEEEPAPDRQGHRRGDDQHLPLRHLPAHPRGGPHGGRQSTADRPASRTVREGAMRKMTFGKGKNLSRRKFIVGSAAAAGGGLALGLSVPFAGEALAQNGARRTKSTSGSRSSRTTPASSASRAPRWGRARSPAWRSSSPKSSNATGARSRPRASPPAATSRPSAPGATCRTGGSRGIRGSQDYVRRGGAAARMMLLQAAADQWKVPVAEVTVSKGVITHAATQAHDPLRQGRGGRGEADAARSEGDQAQGPEELEHRRQAAEAARHRRQAQRQQGLRDRRQAARHAQRRDQGLPGVRRQGGELRRGEGRRHARREEGREGAATPPSPSSPTPGGTPRRRSTRCRSSGTKAGNAQRLQRQHRRAC